MWYLRLWPKREGPFAEITFHSPARGKHLVTALLPLLPLGLHNRFHRLFYKNVLPHRLLLTLPKGHTQKSQ